MSASLALYVWLIFLLGLLCFDPARDRRVSAGVWVPVIWLFIVGSRLPSQWLGSGMSSVAVALEENPLDSAIYSTLILLAIGILTSRSFEMGYFLRTERCLDGISFLRSLERVVVRFPLRRL